MAETAENSTKKEEAAVDTPKKGDTTEAEDTNSPEKEEASKEEVITPVKPFVDEDESTEYCSHSTTETNSVKKVKFNTGDDDEIEEITIEGEKEKSTKGVECSPL